MAILDEIKPLYSLLPCLQQWLKTDAEEHYEDYSIKIEIGKFSVSSNGERFYQINKWNKTFFTNVSI